MRNGEQLPKPEELNQKRINAQFGGCPVTSHWSDIFAELGFVASADNGAPLY